MRTIFQFILLGAILSAPSGFAADFGPAAKVDLVHVPNGGQAVAAEISRDGIIHLLYDAGNTPYYVESSDGGASFSSPIPVVNKAARRPGLVFAGASLAVGRRDEIYVAMSTNNWRLKLSSVPEGLVYTTLAPGAKAFAPVRTLNKRPSEGFSLAADLRGDVAATWLAGKLFANFSHDGGKTFSPDAEINPRYLPCECCTTSAVYGSDGDLAILYRERTDNNRDMFVVLVKERGGESRTRVSSTLWKINACPMTYYMISAVPGGYVAAWPTKGDIYFARLDKGGRVLPPGEIRTPGQSSMRSGVVALGAPDGESLVAWKHEGELGWQLYDRLGRPEGNPGYIKSPGKGVAAVVDRNGQFILFQ